MTRLRIVRSNGAWFIQDDKGTQKVPKFYPTLEEAREAAKNVKEPEVTPAKETKDDKKREGRVLRKK